MAITKHDIDNVSLNIVSEGYDPEEVDLLLEHIAEEVNSFNRALIEAAARVEAAEARAHAAEHQAAQSAQMAQSAQASGQTVASERQIAQALIAAQKSADDLREAARSESEKAYREAEKRARDIVRDALSEKQHIIDEVDRLRESTETFRSEYMAVLGRFTAEAQKVMPKLEDSAPDFAEEKLTTAEAIRAIKDGDAAFEAPDFTLVEEEYVSISATFEDAAQQPISYAAVPTAYRAAQASRVDTVQPTFELDDDLDIDIEEID